MKFTRGYFGLRAYARFLSSPLVWVEGEEDVEALAPLSIRYGFEVRSAGGRPAAEELARTLVRDNLSYTVVLDGDYEILNRRKRSSHRRRIVLRRYAMENYLAEESAVTTLCLGLSRCEKLGSLWNDGFASMHRELENKLKKIVVLDIAQQRAGLGISVLPNAIDSLMLKPTEFIISEPVVEAIAKKVRPLIPVDILREASTLLAEFLRQHRFVDVIPGHLLFSAIRWLVRLTVNRHGQKAQLDYKMLRAVLAANAWTRVTSPEHRVFIDHLRSSVNETRRMRSNERTA